MQLFNSLSRKKEKIEKKSDEKVTLYTCGPTVYDVAHIGNMRANVFYDTLRRALRFDGFEVLHAMNITDVDDKTIKRAGGDKGKFDEIVKRYEDLFWSDLAQLNIEKPDIITRATEYIENIVKFISDLIEKGFAYKKPDGSVYFSIEKFEDYGKLSHLDKSGLQAGARVNQDEYDKENPADFALWKAWTSEDGEIAWETALGKGRPGWHIECSVMAQDVLGETIDIHAGGIDLMFPHHENEIAQSEARTGKKFVNVWVHNEHLLVDGKKMSKSLNNFYTLKDLKTKGFDPLDFRYLALQAHYRSKLNFTWEGMAAAKNSRERLVRIVSELDHKGGNIDQAYLKKFRDFISDDLGLPDALAVVWELARDTKIDRADKYSTILEFDKVLGLKLGEREGIEIPIEILKMAEERKSVREAKDFQKSDELRDKIKKAGWTIEDLAENTYKLIKS